MLVLDASAALELLLRTEKGEQAFDAILSDGGDVHAPHVIDVEVTQILRRLVLRKDLDPGPAQRALDHLSDFRIERYPHTLLLGRIWELRNSVSAYDGAYIALSEILHAPLITCDGRLSRSHGHRADIRLIA